MSCSACRDELIAYYTELGEEAAKREQRALWRIRRARLETARWQLLEAEEQKWRMEMEERKRALVQWGYGFGIISQCL